MARVNIPVTAASGMGAEGKEVTFVAGDAVNNHKLLNRLGSRVLLFVKNGLTAVTVTIQSVTMPVHADDIVDVVPENKTYVFGPFPASLYTQPSGDDQGYIQVDIDSASNVELYAIAL